MNTRRYNEGLSLVEMMIVLGLIALLATMVITVATRIESQSKERGVKSTFALLEAALEEYKEFQGDFPVQPRPRTDFWSVVAHSGFLYTELYSIPGSRKILDKIINPQKHAFVDPWYQPLDYRYAPGDNYPELVSAGPDRKFDTADDITNR